MAQLALATLIQLFIVLPQWYSRLRVHSGHFNGCGLMQVANSLVRLHALPLSPQVGCHIPYIHLV